MRKSRCDKTGRKDMGRQRGREGCELCRIQKEARTEKWIAEFQFLNF
jgi:hypothetical protein